MPVELAVVPVAGKGTRMQPLTRAVPKELLPVGDKPVVDYVAEELERAGIRHMLLVTAADKTSIENHFDVSGKTDRVTVSAVRQPEALGLGHAILCSQTVVDGRPFVVALGDAILGCRGQANIVQRMITVFEREAADVVIALEKVPAEHVHRYGIADVCHEQTDFLELQGIVEKPARDNAPSFFAVAARYVFRAEIFEHLAHIAPGQGGEIQLTDAIARWIDQGGRVLGVATTESERRYDIGNMKSYFEAFADFVSDHPDYKDSFNEFLRSSPSVHS